jgi:catechol 2,3-dioxygenase-like lactoylglutathione lyase family enzyme
MIAPLRRGRSERATSHSSKPSEAGSCDPVVVINRVVAYADGDQLAASREFYVEVLGFDVAMEDPVLGLTSPTNPAAQVLIPPPGMENPQPRFGIDVGEPDAVDAAHSEAVRRGLRVVYPLRTEPWGVRRFFVEDPGGTVINVLAHLR